MTPKLNAFGDVGDCPVVGDFGDFGDFAPVCTPAGDLEPDFPAVDAFAPDGPALADFAFADLAPASLARAGFPACGPSTTV